MRVTVYTVYYLHETAQADMFRGRTSKLVGTYLNPAVAADVASVNSGWVEEEVEDCHPDFIASMHKQDALLRAEQLKITTSVRSMLANGG